jgi:hypothetical protein
VDDALVVRDDLRSYALRRCIRFYSAILVACVAWTGSRLAGGQDRTEILWGGALLPLVVACVEVAAMVASLDMARARRRLGGGPETPLWAFAQGPWPSALAAALFAGLALAALLLA